MTYCTKAEHVASFLLAPGPLWRPCGRQLSDNVQPNACSAQAIWNVGMSLLFDVGFQPQ
jgi:hypothetical protein